MKASIHAAAAVLAIVLVPGAGEAWAQRGGRGGVFNPSQFPPPGGRGGRLGAPVRDDQQAPKGTARISGRVVAADRGTPVRRAQVRLASSQIRLNRVATTDNDGRYELAELPAGQYRLMITKAGFVTLEFGQARPFERGKPLDLADGQALDKIDFSLPRGSVITGRITDEFGEPIADATVEAMRYQFINGQRQLAMAARPATTDDIGQYRIFGLMPGDYVIRASVRAAGTLGGGTEAADPSGYPPTFYPGTTDAGQAQAVTVGLAQEVSSIYLQLSPARLARISGTVIDSKGQPLTGAVIMLRPAAGGAGLFNMGGASQVRGDGSFALTSVPPGDYSLDVQQRPRGGQNGATAQPEFASLPLSVAGADISGLTVVTTPGASVSGTVVLQGQSTAGVTLRSMLVSAPPASGATLPGLGGAFANGRVSDDGSFELRGLAGPRYVRVTNIPAGWTLKSVTLDGQDITDAPFDFRSPRGSGALVITLGDRVSTISGAVHDSRGEVLKDYVVVIFGDDPRLWSAQSRYIATARPNQDGVFSAKGLPPGRYLAAVVDSLENGTQFDPALLEQLRGDARTFTLAEGQTLTLDLAH